MLVVDEAEKEAQGGTVARLPDCLQSGSDRQGFIGDELLHEELTAWIAHMDSSLLMPQAAG